MQSLLLDERVIDFVYSCHTSRLAIINANDLFCKCMLFSNIMNNSMLISIPADIERFWIVTRAKLKHMIIWIETHAISPRADVIGRVQSLPVVLGECLHVNSARAIVSDTAKKLSRVLVKYCGTVSFNWGNLIAITLSSLAPVRALKDVVNTSVSKSRSHFYMSSDTVLEEGSWLMQCDVKMQYRWLTIFVSCTNLQFRLLKFVKWDSPLFEKCDGCIM